MCFREPIDKRTFANAGFSGNKHKPAVSSDYVGEDGGQFLQELFTFDQLHDVEKRTISRMRDEG